MAPPRSGSPRARTAALSCRRSARSILLKTRGLLRSLELGYYHLVDEPAGRGRPVEPPGWDRQYRAGHWRFLNSLDETARYGVISGYLRHLVDLPSILDLGCGEGRLLDFLNESVRDYVGVDISQEAINQAGNRLRRGVAFHCDNIETWQSTGQFHAIVFNESLYYVSDPLQSVTRYLDALDPRGVLIISMFRHRNTNVIWRRIHDVVYVLDSTEVRNSKGETTDIKALVPRRRASEP
jgi:2-polyprenyl-3-methyl-5-hydroxy-6-metoxy-1,4-benzoquinol methylase